jgi:hypothetical protein
VTHARVDQQRQRVCLDGQEWTFVLDLRRDVALLQGTQRLLEVRPQSWGEKRRLARFASMGEDFVRHQLREMCVNPGGDDLVTDELEAALALAAWLSSGGDAGLPLDPGALMRATLTVCRELGVKPETLDALPAYDVESLWRQVNQAVAVEDALWTGTGEEFTHRIEVVPDGPQVPTRAADRDEAQSTPRLEALAHDERSDTGSRLPEASQALTETHCSLESHESIAQNTTGAARAIQEASPAGDRAETPDGAATPLRPEAANASTAVARNIAMRHAPSRAESKANIHLTGRNADLASLQRSAMSREQRASEMRFRVSRVVTVQYPEFREGEPQSNRGALTESSMETHADPAATIGGMEATIAGAARECPFPSPAFACSPRPGHDAPTQEIDDLATEFGERLKMCAAELGILQEG